jgi:streptomycin 6-kinase
VTNLASVTQTQLDQWKLRRDGEPIQGPASIVLPVRTADGVPAVLKISLPDAESEHEHLEPLRRNSEYAAAGLVD